MIRKILVAVMLAAGFSSSAFAQASFTVKDSASLTQTFKSFNCSSTICSMAVPADQTGTAFGTSANPFFMTSTSTLSANVFNTVTVSPVNFTQPVSGSITANLGTIAGVATATNQPTNAAQASTTSGQTGTLVQCAVTTAAPTYTTAQTDPLSCDTAGNIRVNVTNANPNGQATAASSSPVVLASNQSVGDPCMFQTKTNTPISTNVVTSIIVPGVSAKRIYVCSIALIASAATAVSLAEGASNNCVGSAAAVMGVSSGGTYASGMSFAANGGLTSNGGSSLAQTGTNANFLCLINSAGAGATVSGNLTYVQQ